MKKKKAKPVRVITPDKIFEGGDEYYTENEDGSVEHLYTDPKDKFRRGSIDDAVKEIWKEKNDR